MKNKKSIIILFFLLIFTIPLFSCDKEVAYKLPDNEITNSGEVEVGSGDDGVNYNEKDEINDSSDGETNNSQSEEIINNNEQDEKFNEVLDLPIIELITEESIDKLTKEEYMGCFVSVKNADEEYCFDSYTAQIRGRGNSSWDMYDKKSYKLQFVKSDTNGKKVDLFGNGEAKTWTFIANHGDKSLIRNYLAYSVAEIFSEEMPYTTSTQFAEVYINGEYNGVYLICEQIQTGENRVNINEKLVKKDNRVLPEDTGFLIELDGRAYGEGIENIDFFVANRIPFAVKTPDTEDKDYLDYDENGNGISDYLEYIDNYMESVFNLFENNAEYADICDLIDVDSFAASYIVHELFNCKDCGQSSFFMYKDGGGKLCCGPVWDFDVSSGNCNFNDTPVKGDISSPELLWAKEINPFYNNLLKYEEFRSLVSEKLADKADAIRKTVSSCVDYAFKNARSFERNFERWKILDMYIWPNTQEIVSIHSWVEQARYAEWWLNRSLLFMTENYTLD